MGQTTENIKEALSLFASKRGPAAIVPAVVVDVNNDDTIAVQLDSDLVIDDARLKSVVTGTQNKFVLVPKVGSVVLIGRIDGSEEYYVVAVEEITSIKSVIGSTVFSQDADGFLMKKGSETMLKIMADLLDAMINEKHLTNVGPTIGLTPDSLLKYQMLVQRINQFLKSN